MPGHVQPEHLAFQGQLVLVVPFLVGDLDGEHRVAGGAIVGATAEEVELADGFGLLGAQHGFDGVTVHQEQPLAGVLERVERTGLDQRFGDLLVARTDVDLVEVVGEVGVAALGGAAGDQRADDIGADVADRTETEPDVGADGGEVQFGLVDIRRQHRDAQLAAVSQIDRGLVLVVADRGEQAGHVLARIVGLEVGRPIGHQTVAGCVRLVEGVVGEGKDGVPQHFDRPGRESVGLHALGEALVLLVEHLALLLAHRLAQDVGSGQRVTGHLLRDAHDLFLVDDQAIGLGEDLLERLGELGVNRLDRLTAVLAVGVVVMGVHPHWTRPV